MGVPGWIRSAVPEAHHTTVVGHPSRTLPVARVFDAAVAGILPAPWAVTFEPIWPPLLAASAAEGGVLTLIDPGEFVKSHLCAEERGDSKKVRRRN